MRDPLVTEQTLQLRIQATQQSEEDELQRLIQESEDQFEPRKRGCCCYESFKYFFACEGGCNIEMSLFFLLWCLSIIFLLMYNNVSLSTGQNDVFASLLGMGLAFAIPFAFRIQLNKVIKLRIILARTMDTNRVLQKGSQDLEVNVQRALDVQKKLEKTHEVTEDTRKKLTAKYHAIRRHADESNYASGINSKVAGILNSKYLKLLDSLTDELIASERAVVEAVYNNLHMRDGIAGLDREEFKQFVNALPKGYKDRFRFELEEFDQYAGVDGIFDRQELFTVLDRYVEEEALRMRESPPPETPSGATTIIEERSTAVRIDGEYTSVTVHEKVKVVQVV